MTNVYELDGRKLSALPEAHDYLKDMLGFPDYYGKNLDALFDLLTEVSRETIIWVTHYEMMHPKLERTFTDAMGENPHLTVMALDEDEAEDYGTEE